MKVTRKRRRREVVCRLHDASSSLPPGAWELGDRRHASSSPSRRRQPSNSGSEKASREGISHLCPCVSLFSYSSPPAHLLRLSVSPLHLIHPTTVCLPRQTSVPGESMPTHLPPPRPNSRVFLRLVFLPMARLACLVGSVKPASAVAYCCILML